VGYGDDGPALALEIMTAGTLTAKPCSAAPELLARSIMESMI